MQAGGTVAVCDGALSSSEEGIPGGCFQWTVVRVVPLVYPFYLSTWVPPYLIFSSSSFLFLSCIGCGGVCW